MVRGIMRGPAFEPALGFCEGASAPFGARHRNFPTRQSDGARGRIRARRQIGVGPRAIIKTDPGSVRTQRHPPLVQAEKALALSRTTLWSVIAAALFVSL